MDKRKTKVKEFKKYEISKNIKKIKNGVKRNNADSISSHNCSFVNTFSSSNRAQYRREWNNDKCTKCNR